MKPIILLRARRLVQPFARLSFELDWKSWCVGAHWSESGRELWLFPLPCCVFIVWLGDVFPLRGGQ